MKDYLVEYTGPGGFDLSRLINDDYFEAIRILFQARRYVSAVKLLLSCIDTLSYITLGDTPRAFQVWLARYADLAPLGITPEELWEFRNSLLHMTNAESRKVAAGRVTALLFHVGRLPAGVDPDFRTFKSFDLVALIHAVAAAAESLVLDLNANPEHLRSFIERYDLVLSDVRYDEWTFDEPQGTA